MIVPGWNNVKKNINKQFGTSVVKKPDFTKSFEKRAFTGNQDGTNIRRRSFYETKSVSQAVQFMQAGHSMPPPEEEKEKLTYSKYMSEAMSRDIDGRRSNERSGNIEDPLQDRRSFEEREAEAKKAASEAKFVFYIFPIFLKIEQPSL